LALFGEIGAACLISAPASRPAGDPLPHLLFANGAFIVQHEYLIVDYSFVRSTATAGEGGVRASVLLVSRRFSIDRARRDDARHRQR